MGVVARFPALRVRRILAAPLLLAVACAGAPVEPERRVLSVIMADDWASTPPVVDAVRAFEAANPGVTVHVRPLPFVQLLATVAAGRTTGEPPDLVQHHAFAAAATGLAEPLDDLWEQHLTVEEYLPGAVEDVTWAGRRYGVPLDTNAMVLLANPDLLAAAGVDLSDAPTTFADIAAAAEAVTSPDGGVRGIALASSAWATYGWVRANGGSLVQVGDDGSVRFTLDAEPVVEAVAFLGAMATAGTAFPPSARDVSTDSFSLFRARSTALHASGTWDVAALEALDTGWEPVVLPLPRGADGTTSGSALGGSSLFVPKGSDKRELAFELMLALTEDDIALRLAKEQGRLPARVRVFDDPFFDTPVYRTVLGQLETASPLLTPAFPEAEAAFKQAYEDVFTGRSSAEEALARAQRIAEDSLAP